jgi:Fe-S oxidoreductase
MHELLPDDQDANRLRDHTVTLAELLTEHTHGWEPPRAPAGSKALAQVHCHLHAIMGWDADQDLLDRAGVDTEHLESGCCGLAGNFAFTAGHGEISEALAEQTLLPRLRSAEEATAVLADGFSCRTQIHDLDSGGREAVHLAQLLSDLLHRQTQTSSPEPRGGTR